MLGYPTLPVEHEVGVSHEVVAVLALLVVRLLLVLFEQGGKLGGEVAEVAPELPVLPRVALGHVLVQDGLGAGPVPAQVAHDALCVVRLPHVKVDVAGLGVAVHGGPTGFYTSNRSIQCAV